MTRVKSKAGSPAPAPKAPSLRVALPPGMTREKKLAMLAADGAATNAYTMAMYCQNTYGRLELGDAIDVLRAGANEANAGDLSASVTMLSSQAAALNAMFNELARRSALNMGEHLDASERYMRLALKAQGQCRATLETLATIKNPPVVFARQANINNGGQQQVNNAAPRTGESASAPNKLIEENSHGGTPVDPGTTTATGRTNQGLETVGVFNRSAD